MADRDDDLSWWDEQRPPLSDDDEAGSLPPFAWTSESVSALDHVRSLLRQPLLGETVPPPAPNLRSAAAEKLRAAGLFGETPAADDAALAAADAQAEWMGPRSWKLPARGTRPAILGDDTAAGPLRGTSPNIGPAPSAPAPLDHPDAQTGLALTAADTLLTKGIDLAVTLAGGDAAVARKLVEAAANGLAGILPEEFRASALTSASAAAAEAERRIGDNDRAARARAALGTLAHRSNEAEQEHAAAVVAGDRSKIEDARRDAIDAWRAERRARGDGEAEINAGARALERAYRKSALRHRLAQLDEAGIARALDEDDDAKADPALAREVAADIRRVRSEDPARAGEASIEREIAARKRDGRIATPEEEAAARYKLRLDAQAQRGIPEADRRVLTNAERTKLALEYQRIESANGKAAADNWLDEQTQQAGPLAQRFKAEAAAPPRGGARWRDLDQALAPSQPQIAELPGIAGDAPPPSEVDQGRVEPAQDYKVPAAPPAPGSQRLPPTTEAERRAREEEITKEISERHSALPRDDWRARIDLIVEISKREGFVPFIVRRRLWEQIVTADRRVRVEERLASAHAIAELQRLFPQDIERHLSNGDLAVIAEIVRLDEEDKTDAGKIVDTAKKNTGYPDFRLIFGAMGSMRGGRPIRDIGGSRPRTPEELAKKQRQIKENRAVGGSAEEQGRQIIIRDIERMKVSAWSKRLVWIEGDGGTIPDLPIGTKSDQIRLYVDVKKFGARHREPQKRRLRMLDAHIVEINPNNGDMRALAPPYDRWISYEEWLRLVEKLLSEERQ